MEVIIGAFNEALLITGFVFVMMLVIEYLNVLTHGSWQKKVASLYFGQYLFAAFMGLIPGCLGAFVVVAMYSHRMLTVGAVVAAMIATTGDEAYVMLSLIPKETFLLMGILFVLGVAVGMFTDLLLKRKKMPTSIFKDDIYSSEENCDGFQYHSFEPHEFLSIHKLFSQWKGSSPNRIILTLVLGLFIVGLLTRQVGPDEWNWVRISILIVTIVALFIVVTVSEHFLKEHLWEHVALKHVPRIFAWTFGTLFIMQILVEYLPLKELIQQNLWTVLGISSLIGLIPESGPHLIFVTLFAGGTLPFGIFLASSIVQDGHGMLPLLAHSPRTFLVVKLINLCAGLIAGAIVLVFLH